MIGPGRAERALPGGWAARLEALSVRAGLNVAGVVDGAPWQEVLPGCRSVIVLASGGAALWERFVEDLQRDPRGLTDEDHPLDAFIQRQIQAIDPAPGLDRVWVRCAAEPERFIDFRVLALEAGLGWRSRLGLLLHPTWGPWMGLRAACFTTEPLPTDAPLSGEGPCETCAAPCAAACPAGAIQPSGMDIQRCASFHQESARCADTCHARLACPEGAAHRYPDLERSYHYDRADGRRRLAAALGVDDQRIGRNPRWGEWS